jgi:hypothetical protein
VSFLKCVFILNDDNVHWFVAVWLGIKIMISLKCFLAKEKPFGSFKLQKLRAAPIIPTTKPNEVARLLSHNSHYSHRMYDSEDEVQAINRTRENKAMVGGKKNIEKLLKLNFIIEWNESKEQVYEAMTLNAK